MNTSLLAEVKHMDKFIVFEKEIAYRIAREHYTDQEIQKIKGNRRGYSREEMTELVPTIHIHGPPF